MAIVGMFLVFLALFFRYASMFCRRLVRFSCSRRRFWSSCSDVNCALAVML